MSQPPPPPNQPPQDPQSGPSLGKQDGGYGYPQQPGQPPTPPPAQPSGGGYGYPQQPQQPHQAPTQAAGFPAQPPPGPPGPPAPPGPPGPPPGQSGAYGQPPTPPPGGGYGYPQQPGQQPYGQPPYGQDPGMYPTMPPGSVPGGSGGGNNSKMIAIIAAVVAVVLIAGGGIWFLTKGGDDKDTESKGDTKGASQGAEGKTDGGKGGDKPVNADAEMLFKMEAPAVDDVTAVPGAWATDKVFAKSAVETIKGVNAADGSEAWEIELSGGVCAASPHQTEDNKTAIVTRETKSSKADCNQIAVIDLEKGEKVWQEKLPGDADVNSLGGGVTLSGGTIATAWIGGSAGYKITGGEPIWTAKPGNCRDEGYAGGKRLVAVVRCGSYSSPQFKVQVLDPETGKSAKEFEAPKGVESVAVASTDPLVIGVGAGTTVTTDIMTVSEDGELAAKISLGERYNKPCGSDVESCFGMVADKDHVYLSTKEHDDASSDYGRTNEVMAFDFNTGKTVWKSDGGAKRSILPIATEDGKVIAYKMPTYDSGGQVVAIDAKTGKQTVYLKLPSAETLDYEQELKPNVYGQDVEVVWENGKLFFQEKLISERKGSFTDERLLAAGFGSN